MVNVLNRGWGVQMPNDKLVGDLGGNGGPFGRFFGIGDPPTSIEAWRNPLAVLDEYNSDHYLMIIKVIGGELRAMAGKVASQLSKEAKPGLEQILDGGGMQAFTEIVYDAYATDEITKYLDKVTAKASGIPPAIHTETLEFTTTVQLGKGGKKVTVEITLRPSGYTSPNGKYGWGTPTPGGVAIRPLGYDELEPKKYMA